jgi:hypothetical protein
MAATTPSYRGYTCVSCGVVVIEPKRRGRPGTKCDDCRKPKRATVDTIYGRTKPDDPTYNQSARVREAVHNEIIALRSNDPDDPDYKDARTTCRFCYYRVVAKGVVEKGDAGYGEVVRALTWLREQDLVGWHEVVDDSRSIRDYSGETDPIDNLRGAVTGMKLCRWGGNPPVVVVESRSLAGFLAPLASKYRVVVVPLGGQSSGSHLYHNVSPLIRFGNPTIFYLGDWDKAGRDIQSSAADRLRYHVPEWFGRFEKLAVTEDQFTRYEHLVIRKVDDRDGIEYDTLETEAIDQHELEQCVSSALDDLSPLDITELRARERVLHKKWNRIIERYSDSDLEDDFDYDDDFDLEDDEDYDD